MKKVLAAVFAVMVIAVIMAAVNGQRLNDADDSSTEYKDIVISNPWTGQIIQRLELEDLPPIIEREAPLPESIPVTRKTEQILIVADLSLVVFDFVDANMNILQPALEASPDTIADYDANGNPIYCIK